MTTTWYLIQYIADLHRRESKNVGIATESNGKWGLRMIGLRRTGEIDGRALRALQHIKADEYRSWTRYLQYAIQSNQWDHAMMQSIRRPSNFTILHGGKIFEQSPLSSVTNDLFEDLVAVPKTTHRDREQELDEEIRRIFSEAGVSLRKNVEVEVGWKDLRHENTHRDSVRFEYEASLTTTAYFDRLPLAGRVTPNSEMRSRDFYSRAEAAHRLDKSLHFGAFYSSSMAEGLTEDSLDSLLRPVEAVGRAVDIDNFDDAVLAARELTAA